VEGLLNLEPPPWFSSKPVFVNFGHAKLTWNGLAEGTRRGYLSAQRSFERCCAMHGFNPWPASAKAICTWLTERLLGAGGKAPIKPNSALSDLAAIRAFHTDNQLPEDILDKHAKHFRRMIDGARRLQPNPPKRDRRPISRLAVAKVSQIPSSLPLQTPPPPLTPAKRDDLNVAVAARVAFAGFLRVGEFTYTQKDIADPRTFTASKLTRADIRFSPTFDHAQLTLKRSKADRNHEGVNIILAATTDEACPVDALRKLFLYDPRSPQAPLFSFSSGPFSSKAFQTALLSKLRKVGENTAGIKGHSFRKGAAQHAHEAGILHEQIQALGRWSSEAFRLYFSTPVPTLYAWNRQFQTGSPTPINPPPSPPPTSLGPLVHLGASGALPSA
jgi:integrase